MSADEMDTAAIRARHRVSPTWANSGGGSGGERCAYCPGMEWPCQTVRLLDEIDRLRSAGSAVTTPGARQALADLANDAQDMGTYAGMPAEPCNVRHPDYAAAIPCTKPAGHDGPHAGHRRTGFDKAEHYDEVLRAGLRWRHQSELQDERIDRLRRAVAALRAERAPDG